MNIGAAWREVRDRFRAAGMDTPELDARLLANKAFGLDTLALSAREREIAPVGQLLALQALADRRLQGEPVARILGEKEFYGLAFTLGDATLIPRPETEMLVDLGLSLLAGRQSPRILDLGTGTGAIIVALLAVCPAAEGTAIDFSAEAIETARGNAKRHGVAGRLDLRVGSWFDPIGEAERFDLIVANPPYIETAEISDLPREVRDHDPVLALDGGLDGLIAYGVIAAEAMQRLSETGVIAVEIGSKQAKSVTKLLSDAGFSHIRTEKDLAGLDRVVLAHHP